MLNTMQRNLWWIAPIALILGILLGSITWLYYPSDSNLSISAKKSILNCSDTNHSDKCDALIESEIFNSEAPKPSPPSKY